MSKPLPGIGQLLADSWRTFTATWSQNTQITIWFLYIGLAVFLVSVLAKFDPWAILLAIPVQIAAAVISIWCGIRLMLALLKSVDEKPIGDLKKDSALAWTLFLPMVLVGLLQGLVVLGGFVLLVIPGIYLLVAMAYAQMVFVDQGVRGWKALTISRDLVRGRWWGVFWRNLVASLLMGLGLGLLVYLALGILTLLAGGDYFRLMSGGESSDPIVQGAASLLDSILQAAFLPFILGFQVRFYRTLQRTR